MRLFNKIAIVGVGLIGGSIALAIKKKKLAHEVIGVSRHRKSLLLARKRGAIDRGAQQIEIIKDADLVILAAPVSVILNLAPRISKIIRPDCIVTDVGSTKAEIVAKLEKIFPFFVGSHPLAGSEKRGVFNACPELFKGSLCILTPTKKTAAKTKKRIVEFWNELGARVIFLSASNHDRALSFISHLPHVAAFSLMSSVPNQYLKFAANSLKEATRIASSDIQLWADIFLSNRKNMAASIASLERNLKKIKSAIGTNNRRILLKVLKGANSKRELLR